MRSHADSAAVESLKLHLGLWIAVGECKGERSFTTIHYVSRGDGQLRRCAASSEEARRQAITNESAIRTM
jgi:hypothetical protein